uniref:Si:ch211-107m4.1 n=1 Tax=Takifugu rubripes TaxID=31033 RepID=H2U6G2_TAKRU
MKLDDIKKLKVPELRSKLKELGLDAKGLKAELATRLWSASEARTCGDVEEKLKQNDTTADTLEPRKEETGASARKDRCKELADSATQTETHPDLCAAQEASELIPACVPQHQVGGGEVDMQQGGEEDCEESSRAQPPDVRGRGRAFYEFKEEIRYKSSFACTDDSHLHFEVHPDGSGGQPRFWDRFPLLWSGCRLTHGVLQGRVGFEVRVERTWSTTQLDYKDDKCPHGLRVGWSTPDTSLLLGEDNEESFAYDGHGIKASGGTEQEFGEPFSVGDIIGCYASFSTDATEISFHKNGRFMGVAFSLRSPALLGRPLFPHVLCKGCSVRFHLDPTGPPWYPGRTGFTPLVTLPSGQSVHSTFAPRSGAQCEVLLMVGLPGSGKSRWARTHTKQHPDKLYRLLGTEELLSCMIVSQTAALCSGTMIICILCLQQAAQCLTDLIKLAAQTPGNYILDQCNILFSARRYKLQLFGGFRRKVVVVFPSAGEWNRRLSELFCLVPVSCSLPEQQSDLLEELLYVELPQEQAQKLLQEYKDEAHRLLPPIPKPEKKRPKLHKKRPYPHRTQWAACRGQHESTVLFLDALVTSGLFLFQWNVAYQDPGYYYYRDYNDVGYW